MAKPKDATLDRRIIFYSTKLLDLTQSDEPVVAADQSVLWQQLAKMPFHDRERIYKPSIREAAEVSKAADGTCYEGRIFRTKFSDLPLLGKGENDRDLDTLLDDEEGLRTPAHFVWWDVTKLKEMKGVAAPIEGLLALEVSQGPRANALEDYVSTIFSGKLFLALTPIFERDVWKQLEDRRYVKKIRARVPLHGSLKVPKGNMSGLYVANNLGGIETVEWTLSPGRSKKLDLRDNIAPLRDLVESDTKVTMTVETGGGHVLDLTESKMMYKVRPMRLKPDTRAVDKQSMYAEIRMARHEIRDRLLHALGRHDEQK